MNIVITGLTACGKSYLSKKLAQSLNYEYINSSSILLEMLNRRERLKENKKRHFWIREKTIIKIETWREENNLDIKLDKYIQKLAKTQTNLIIESRTLGWIYKGSNLLKIYLNPSLEDRALIAYKSKEEKEFSLEELKKKIDSKDKRDIKRFKRLYGIDISDPKGFDYVLDNGKLEPSETLQRLLNFISTH